MAMAYERGPAQRGGPVQRGPAVSRQSGASSLADLLNVILDKGLVVDAWVRLSVIGIEILTLEARVVVASVDTYLRYAEAIGQTALAAAPPAQQPQRAFSNRNGQGNGRPHLDEGEVLSYLEDRPDGARLGELQAYFDAPRHEVMGVLDDLVDDDRVRRDEERRVYLPANGR